MVDHELTRFEVVWADAGDEHSMFATSAVQLVALTRGELVDVAEAAAEMGDGTGAQRLTVAGNIPETGTTSYRLAHARSRTAS